MWGMDQNTAQQSLPLDPLTQPLAVAAPATWAGRERRVEWMLRNFTKGEKALLYRLLHDVERVSIGTCAAVERTERHGLG